MTLGCGEFNESVLDLLYGEIDGPKAESLREHAASCPACREVLEGLILTRKLAAELPPVEADDGDRDALLALARHAAGDFSAGRGSRPEDDLVPARPAFIDRGPGLLDRLRAALLRPAFATAAAASLVLAVAIVLYQQGGDPVRGSESESEAPFIGPVGRLRQWSPLLEATPSSAPAPGGPGEGTSTAVAESSGSAAAPARRRAVGSLGTGKGGGGSAREAEITTAGPEPAGGKPPAAPPLPAATAAAEERAADDSWPEARDEDAELDALPAKKTKAAAGTAAAQPSASGDWGSAGPPGNGEAAYLSALAAYQRGDCATAIPLLEGVVADPGVAAGTRASALHHVALCQKRAGHCSRAVEHYDALLGGYPGYGRRPDALWEAAACHRRLGDLSEARRKLMDLARYPAWRERAFDELRVIDELGGDPP